MERSNTPNGWQFLASDDKLTYMHVDGQFHTKENLDNAIISWIEDYEYRQGKK